MKKNSFMMIFFGFCLFVMASPALARYHGGGFPVPVPIFIPPPVTYYQQPEVVVVPQPREVCWEKRMVNGEWRHYRGESVWVEFSRPRIRRVQVPCY